MSTNWKELLKNQQDDIARLEAMDQELVNSESDLAAESESVLKDFKFDYSSRRPLSLSNKRHSMVLSAKQNKISGSDFSSPQQEYHDSVAEEMKRNRGSRVSLGGGTRKLSSEKRQSSSIPSVGGNHPFSNSINSNSGSVGKIMHSNSPDQKKSNIDSLAYDHLYNDDNTDVVISQQEEESYNPLANSSTKKSQSNFDEDQLSSPSKVTEEDIAPETNDRFLKAKLKVLTRELAETTEVKSKLYETNKDLQKQLKLEREETKRLQKRIQNLELELRKTSSGKTVMKRPASGSENKVDNLLDDINRLKRDLDTSERISKNSLNEVKSKDLQLKRAVDTIGKLKAQVAKLEGEAKSSGKDQKSIEHDANIRVKTLEKQRAELIDAFKKQMKLIDVLKRQKVHIEAAKILSFTEDDFMKTLDWKP